MAEISIDLSSLAGFGFKIAGEAEGDQAGYSVSTAGDINGDGYADMIVGARLNGNGGVHAGAAYVIFGAPTGSLGDVGLSSLGAYVGFTIQGNGDRGWAGASVSSAGDVNGDGIDDLMVGVPNSDRGGLQSGNAFVIFGRPGETRDDIDLAALATGDGFAIQGASTFDFTGKSVSAAGDINGDGIDDVIVGAPGGDTGGSYGGEAYVLFGKAGSTRDDIDLETRSGGDGFMIYGSGTSDFDYDTAGQSVSNAGDVNGDGIDDLIVGAPNGGELWNFPGDAYIIFGRSGGLRGDIDLASLSPADGFRIRGAEHGDNLGMSVSGAGDVNGDGFDDIILGAPYAGIGGEAYVIFGREGAARGDIYVSSLAAADGFRIATNDSGAALGFSVSNAGDVNGDGFADVIVGAPNGDHGGNLAGDSYVVFGRAGATRSDIDLSTLTADEGFVVHGEAFGDQTGRAVSAAGDINKDGYDDILIGAPSAGEGGVETGTAYFILGRAVFGPANAAPVAAADSAATAKDTPVVIAVLANDSDADGDDLAVTGASDPADGSVVVSPDGSVTYTPDAGFRGQDSFTYTVSDGMGGSDTGSVSVQVGPAPIRVVAFEDFAGGVGGTGEIFGTNGFQDLTLLGGANDFAFDGSFGRGGDVLRLAGDASAYTAAIVGTGVELTDGTSRYSIPIGQEGTYLVFADGVRALRFDAGAGEVLLGSQAIGGTPAPITAPDDGSVLPTGADPAVSSRVVLFADAEAGVDGDYTLFGTNAGAETVRYLGGDISLDGSFGRGGDEVVLTGEAETHTAYLSGTSLVLVTPEGEVTMPVGTAGMDLDFAGDMRTLAFDGGAGAVLIGEQAITATSAGTAQGLVAEGFA